jgi:hypothetical protein
MDEIFMYDCCVLVMCKTVYMYDYVYICDFQFKTGVN